MLNRGLRRYWVLGLILLAVLAACQAAGDPGATGAESGGPGWTSVLPPVLAIGLVVALVASLIARRRRWYQRSRAGR